MMKNSYGMKGVGYERLWYVFPVLTLIMCLWIGVGVVGVESVVGSGGCVLVEAYQWGWYVGGVKCEGVWDWSRRVCCLDRQEVGMGCVERVYGVVGSGVVGVGSGELLCCVSRDVIHCLCVGGLGVKCDCVPGRVYVVRVGGLGSVKGVWYGMCMELCGVSHSVMGVSVVVVWCVDMGSLR